MKTIELTQGQVAIVDDVDYDFLMQWKWQAARCPNCFRAMRTVCTGGKRETLRMHTPIAERMGIDPKLIDHKDQNPLNNRRSNLRSATSSQNLHNRGIQLNNKTGVKGVYFDRVRGKYQTRIMVGGKTYHLGYFDTIPEAERVIVAKRKELVGEFAAV